MIWQSYKGTWERSTKWGGGGRWGWKNRLSSSFLTFGGNVMVCLCSHLKSIVVWHGQRVYQVNGLAVWQCGKDLGFCWHPWTTESDIPGTSWPLNSGPIVCAFVLFYSKVSMNWYVSHFPKYTISKCVPKMDQRIRSFKDGLTCSPSIMAAEIVTISDS